jgi:hypothetical protein
VVTCGVLAVASSQGLRIPAEEFQTLDFRSNGLLSSVPLHDVWAIELEGNPSATLEDLIRAYGRFSPLQATPALTTLGLTRGLAGTLLSWEDPRWTSAHESFLPLLAEEDRQRSSTYPGTQYGIWRVLYTLPREGVVETINGTAHVAVAASIGSGSEGPLLYLSFRVREVNWTTPYYMSLIDPARRYFVYPPLLRQFAHTWGTGG